jgi:RNA polymerase sigma-70 factor (ECF subfamily)
MPVASEEKLLRAVREANEAWPDVRIPAPAFAAYVAARDPLAEPSHLRDLYLACACIEGDARAVAVLDREFFAPLVSIVAQAGYDEQVGSEVAQALRQRLLVASGDRPPGIGDYGARAPLAAWLRVAAVREAGKLRRHEGVHARIRPDAPRPAATPEEEAVRARYGGLFETAFAEALRALPPEDRLVLRLHFADGLNLDALAVTLGFSRATAGRRLVLARTRLKDEAMRRFGERLDATHTEVESVLKVLRSGLEVSFGALVSSA